ncbi:hypothetical protein CAT7_02092 [Carnobacterium sp. AT7]|nr:hypothetical protein CAT7_02092 [Carnobacterium sp. AT7]
MIIIKFQWLKDYQETEERIAYLKWNIRRTKYELERWEDSTDLCKVFLVKESKVRKLKNIRTTRKRINLSERCMRLYFFYIHLKDRDQILDEYVSNLECAETNTRMSYQQNTLIER